MKVILLFIYNTAVFVQTQLERFANAMEPFIIKIGKKIDKLENGNPIR